MSFMNLKGTKFQKKVWKYLKKIPKGKVKTYKEVAKAIGMPKVQELQLMHVENPFAPKIPCHRVIRSDGGLVDIIEVELNKAAFVKIRKS